MPASLGLFLERRSGMDEIERLSEDFLERLLAGEEPDRKAFVAAHSEVAESLERRLRLVEMLHRAGRSSSGLSSGAASRAPHPAAEEIPSRIGRFEVAALIGRGSFGSVYRARDTELDRWVAIKVPRAAAFATHRDEQRFLREARNAAGLRHPGVVRVHEVGIDGGLPFIVSDFIPGKTLADRIDEGRIAFKDAAELIARVADALDYAHEQRVTHRDIKPSNILLDASGHPHIADFGLARRAEEEAGITVEGQILGTPAYMAPEQAAGDHATVDWRSDIYALGVVLYEVLTGQRPFLGSRSQVVHQVINAEPRRPRALEPLVPRDLETICLKAMAKERERRYATAAELAADLRRFLRCEPIRARAVSDLERFWRWGRRNPALAALGAAVIALLVAVAAVSSVMAIRISGARNDTRRQLSRLNVETGMRVAEDGDLFTALLWFAEARRRPRDAAGSLPRRRPEAGGELVFREAAPALRRRLGFRAHRHQQSRADLEHRPEKPEPRAAAHRRQRPLLQERAQPRRHASRACGEGSRRHRRRGKRHDPSGVPPATQRDRYRHQLQPRRPAGGDVRQCLAGEALRC
jgi:hypothetical protein